MHTCVIWYANTRPAVSFCGQEGRGGVWARTLGGTEAEEEENDEGKQRQRRAAMNHHRFDAVIQWSLVFVLCAMDVCIFANANM